MRNFIEDYLQNPATAVAEGTAAINKKSWLEHIDDEMVWQQIASPEFRLYEEIIFSPPIEDRSRSNTYPIVA